MKNCGGSHAPGALEKIAMAGAIPYRPGALRRREPLRGIEDAAPYGMGVNVVANPPGWR